MNQDVIDGALRAASIIYGIIAKSIRRDVLLKRLFPIHLNNRYEVGVSMKS